MTAEVNISFHPKYLEDSRKFILSPIMAKCLYHHIGIRKNNCILDVGCGSGYFTREIVKYQKGLGRVIGIDINLDLIQAAHDLAPLPNSPEFLVGDGLSLDFPNDHFDVTICHFVLSRVPEEKAMKILLEMIRVTKKGGTIATVEPCLGAMVAQYYNDYELSLGLTTLRRAKSELQKIEHRINENIGGLMNQIFAKLKLRKISSEVFALPWWTPPPFPSTRLQTDQDLRSWYERRLSAIEKPDDENTTKNYGKVVDAAQVLRYSKTEAMNIPPTLLDRLGLSDDLIKSVQEHRIRYLKSLLSNSSDEYVNDFEIIPVFAVVGKK